MPELPEVEVVRRGLEHHLRGARFESLEIAHPRATRGMELPIEGSTIQAVRRRGKFLWFDLDRSDGVLFVHLGMSGQMLVDKQSSPHVRIVAQMSNGVELSFVDQRTFGRWWFAPLEDIAHVAPDPFEPGFDAASAARMLRKKRCAIKTALLDQSIVSGIGNIYADEALWQARVKPQRRASSLRQRDAVAVLESAAQVMDRALGEGGTSFDSLYVNVNGASGYFSRSLNVYGQTGAPCPRCDSLIQRTVIGGRSSHFCPGCQTF